MSHMFEDHCLSLSPSSIHSSYHKNSHEAQTARLRHPRVTGVTSTPCFGARRLLCIFALLCGSLRPAEGKHDSHIKWIWESSLAKWGYGWIWLDMVGAIAQWWRLSAQNPPKILMKRIDFASRQWDSVNISTHEYVTTSSGDYKHQQNRGAKNIPIIPKLSCLYGLWAVVLLFGRRMETPNSCSQCRPLHWHVHQWLLQLSNIILEDLRTAQGWYLPAI